MSDISSEGPTGGAHKFSFRKFGEVVIGRITGKAANVEPTQQLADSPQGAEAAQMRDMLNVAEQRGAALTPGSTEWQTVLSAKAKLTNQANETFGSTAAMEITAQRHDLAEARRDQAEVAKDQVLDQAATQRAREPEPPPGTVEWAKWYGAQARIQRRGLDVAPGLAPASQPPVHEEQPTVVTEPTVHERNRITGLVQGALNANAAEDRARLVDQTKVDQLALRHEQELRHNAIQAVDAVAGDRQSRIDDMALRIRRTQDELLGITQGSPEEVKLQAAVQEYQARLASIQAETSTDESQRSPTELITRVQQAQRAQELARQEAHKPEKPEETTQAAAARNTDIQRRVGAMIDRESAAIIERTLLPHEQEKLRAGFVERPGLSEADKQRIREITQAQTVVSETPADVSAVSVPPVGERPAEVPQAVGPGQVLQDLLHTEEQAERFALTELPLQIQPATGTPDLIHGTERYRDEEGRTRQRERLVMLPAGFSDPRFAVPEGDNTAYFQRVNLDGNERDQKEAQTQELIRGKSNADTRLKGAETHSYFRLMTPDEVIASGVGTRGGPAGEVHNVARDWRNDPIPADAVGTLFDKVIQSASADVTAVK